MPNILKPLREEITRLARKETKSGTTVLKRSSAQYRRDIAALKRQVANLQRTVAILEKAALKTKPATVPPSETSKLRFVAKGFKTMRAKLGISAGDLGTLLGVSGLTVYNWESGKARPRAKYLPAIAAIRGIGKREVLARLEKVA